MPGPGQPARRRVHVGGRPRVSGGGTDLGDTGSSWSSVALAADTVHVDGAPTSPSLQILADGDVVALVSLAAAGWMAQRRQVG